MELIVITGERFGQDGCPEGLRLGGSEQGPGNGAQGQDGGSPPDRLGGSEQKLVEEMFRTGLQRLHLRKPGASERQLAEWLERIDPQYHRRIVIHDCFELARRYRLGGIHLNSRNPAVPDWLAPAMTVSRSCHSLKELAEWKSRCNYLFLSPIFNSISKHGYGSGFTAEELAGSGLIDAKTVALGGVTSENLYVLKGLGFGGAAVLGTVWKSPDPVSQVRALLSSLQSLHQEPF